METSSSKPLHPVDYNVSLHFSFFCTNKSDSICFQSKFDLGAGKVKSIQMFHMQHILVYLQLDSLAEWTIRKLKLVEIWIPMLRTKFETCFGELKMSK